MLTNFQMRKKIQVHKLKNSCRKFAKSFQFFFVEQNKHELMPWNFYSLPNKSFSFYSRISFLSKENLLLYRLIYDSSRVISLASHQLLISLELQVFFVSSSAMINNFGGKLYREHGFIVILLQPLWMYCISCIHKCGCYRHEMTTIVRYITIDDVPR